MISSFNNDVSECQRCKPSYIKGNERNVYFTRHLAQAILYGIRDIGNNHYKKVAVASVVVYSFSSN